MIKIKSSIKDLESRGYVDENKFQIENILNREEIKSLLFSEIPTDRTKAAITINRNKAEDFIKLLIEVLKNEKKLYCRIAICDALASFGKVALKFLIPNLGMIGNNQHNKLPSKPFEKDGYPLPRDIIGRTLIQIGIDVIPVLIYQMIGENLSRNQILEGIDVLGHISFNHGDKRALEILIELLDENDSDSVMRWKLIRSFSAFNDKRIKKKLEMIKSNSYEEAHVWESKRSLRLINKHNR